METICETSISDRTGEKVRWQNEYQLLINQRLIASIQYIRNHSTAQVKTHLRSFLALLEDAHRYPALNTLMLDLITLLHPLPQRMGYGNRWEPELRFALKRTHRSATQVFYLNCIAANALIRGNCSEAIQSAQKALQKSGQDITSKGLACKILFDAYCTCGKERQAKRLITHYAFRFQNAGISKKSDRLNTTGWLYYSQCRLKLLREQGKVNEALDLANEMLQTDNLTGNSDPERTAALFTERATLLWVKTRFSESASDLNRAIELYTSIDDQYDAEALQSNLGLVYWSKGDFKRAEHAMKTVIEFFTRTGAIQLVTPDIGNLGLVFFCQGRLQQAEEQTLLHIEHARQIGYLREEMRGLSNLADIHFCMGKYSLAIEEHQITDPYLRKHGARDGYKLAHLWVACCQDQLGDQQKALQKARRVLRWCRKNDVPSIEGPANRCLAHLLPPERRLPYLQRALYLARTQNRRLEEAACLFQLAEIAATDEEQESFWNTATAILEQIGASPWLEGHNPSNPPFLPIVR